jgi:hypothetical protein
MLCKRGITKWQIVILILVILLILYLIFFLFFTQTGAFVRGEAGVGGVQVTQGLRGITGPLNILSQVLTGSYNPTNLWRSDQVQSQYAEVRDVGVVLVSANPLRKEFDISQELVIAGRINAVAFPGKEVTATVGACSKVVQSIAGGLPAPVEICLPEGWSCTISGAGASLPVREIRDRPFTCSHAALGTEVLPLAVEVSATAGNTQSVGGKQFVFSSPEVLLSLNEDPLDAFGISRDALTSWQTGDESASVAVNVAGQPTVLETGAEHFLGVRVQNPPSHTGIATLKELQMLLPTPPLMIVSGEDFICKPLASQEELTSALNDFGIRTVPQGQGFTLCTSISQRTLHPSDDVVLFARARIPSGALQNQDFGTFFVLAKAEYDYANLQTVALRVRKLI